MTLWIGRDLAYGPSCGKTNSAQYNHINIHGKYDRSWSTFQLISGGLGSL